MSKQRLVIVTGASQNIGASIAARFQRDGAQVICADINPPRDNSVEFICTNISDETSVTALMDQIAKDYGYLDVLVNNAGICIEVPLEDMSADQWDLVMAVNVKGTFLTTKHALPLMRDPRAKNPTIVNISSIEGLGANPLHSAYGASKAAVAGFTHNTALEYGQYGIRCNAVAPGWINTAFNEQLLAQYPDRAAVDAEIQALHPVGRLGETTDIANTVFWLASTESSFISGQEIIVDGGRLAKLPLPKL